MISDLKRCVLLSEWCENLFAWCEIAQDHRARRWLIRALAEEIIEEIEETAGADPG